jgi:hypothetical protein
MQTTLILSLLAALLAAAPALAAEGGVVQLTGISFGTDGAGTLEGYINALYLLAIGIGAAIAVLRLILAGAKYMLTDVVTQKGEAKKDVQSAVIGLLIILAAILILETINPNLNNFDVLNLSAVNRPVDRANPTEDRIRSFCDDSEGCVRERCPFIRGLVSCQTWCENRDGLHVNNGLMTAAECILAPRNANQVQLGETRVEGTFGCAVETTGEFSEFNCAEAITACTNAGGTRYVENGNSLSCYRSLTDEELGDNLGTESRRISCTEIPGDGISGTLYNCTDARAACDARGEVVRGTYESYIECSG